MDLRKALDDMKYDVRLMNWNLDNRVIKSEEVQKHLKSLPDDESKFEVLTIENEEKETKTSLMNGFGEESHSQ